MSVSEADLRVIESWAAQPADFAALRAQLPHLAITRCDASDVGEAPYRSFARYDLHLMDRAAHCVTLTNDPAAATGIVIAAKGAV